MFFFLAHIGCHVLKALCPLTVEPNRLYSTVPIVFTSASASIETSGKARKNLGKARAAAVAVVRFSSISATAISYGVLDLSLHENSRKLFRPHCKRWRLRRNSHRLEVKSAIVADLSVVDT